MATSVANYDAYLRSEWSWILGRFIVPVARLAEFEEAFAEWVGARYAVSFSSGTAALHGAAFVAGLREGDEALTSPLTFVATANCVLYQRATPVFVDVCADTLNLDPEQLECRISNKARAILAVDYAGHPADFEAIVRIAESRGLVVIEDACHALGAEYRGRRVGSLAHLTVFSFHPVKHLSTGEGGMVTTDDAGWAQMLRQFRNHGISSEARERRGWQYEMVMLGFNYRLTDIACALGISQLTKIEANLARRREIAAQYAAALQGMPELVLPCVRADVDPAWHLYPIRLNLGRLPATREQIFRALRAENIGVNVHYIPVHLQPYYRGRFGYRGGEYPVAENAYERLISLPMFHGMTDEDVGDVISAVEKVCSAYSQ